VSVQNRPFIITDHSKQTTFITGSFIKDPLITDPFLTDLFITDHIHNRLCSCLGPDGAKGVRQNGLGF